MLYMAVTTTITRTVTTQVLKAITKSITKTVTNNDPKQVTIIFHNITKTITKNVNKELLKCHYWGPSAEVTSFPAYFVNGYNFQTERHNTGKSTMNLWGMCQEIIQLTYPLIPNLHIVLFKCCWVDPVRAMKVHPHYHLVDVNFKKLYQKDDLFIVAQQAVHVYFTEYLSMKRDKADWMVVCKTKAWRVVDDSK
ncbi:UNVERIFIED_CONTAM: hypothetical protein Scaly_0077100 [Sesamum calycinum]|uniref:DUF4216 domain-containing protein n=1 Tax=Sesamum calycinum TaxID=2727403 RepID=A0AAW2SV58_9LAMI